MRSEYRREDEELKRLNRAPFAYYYRKYWRSFGLGVVGLFATNALDALPPLIIKRVVDQLTTKASHHQILQTALLFLGVTILTAGTRYVWRMAWGYFQNAAGEDLREQLFAKCTRLGPSFYQKQTVGNIMSLATNDNTAFRMAIGPGTLVFLDGIFILALTLPIMAWLSWSLTWKTLILMPFLPLLIRKVEALINKYFREQQDAFAELSAHAQEMVSGIRVIKSYRQQERQLALFNEISRRYQKAGNQTARVEALFHPLMEFGVASGVVILLFLAGSLDAASAISVGTFVAFFQYIRKMTWPMTAIGLGVTMLQEGRTSFARIQSLLNTTSDIEYEGGYPVPEFHDLEVRHLTFYYEGNPHPSLDDVSFRLRRGETLGIIGPVGAGKSTLIKVISRLYAVPPNTIFINDVPLEKIDTDQLHALLGLVPQDPFLFSDTIRENMSLGLEQTPELATLNSMAQQVSLHREIMEIPGGYDAELGERGVNLSGGQKQRLTLARALIRKSPLIIFDDALSAIDAETEAAILDELRHPKNFHTQKENTSIIITHRLASVRFADKLLVLNNGKVEAWGTHQELAQVSPTYRNLCQLQNFQPPHPTRQGDAQGDAR